MATVNHALDGQTKVVEIVSILSVCCTVTTFLVTLRFITRAWIVQAFGADDWVLLVAQVLAIASAVAIGLEQHFGMGTHVWTIPDLVPYQKSFYASVLVYNASLVLVKASIVLMYRRIFVGKWIQRAIVVALVILTAWGIAVVTSLAMMCLPIQRLWDPTVKGHCIDFVPAFFAPAVINMITDFSIFVMPLPAIRQLQLPLRQKIFLSFVLCLGLFTCVISIVRLSTLDAAATSSDTTWDNTGAALWSYLELTVAIMAACLPTLRPFVLRFFPRLITSTSKASSVPPAGHDGSLQTWGGSGGSSAKAAAAAQYYSKVSDSTDQLYDPEIGMETLPPAKTAAKTSVTVKTTPRVQSYRESVARRGQNETTIGAGSPTSLASDETDEPNAAAAAPGIRATTTIKQEFQKKKSGASR